MSFLADIRASVSVLFLLGDLFDTWFGNPDLQQDHHHEVVEALRAMRAAGVRLYFVEGNREFRIGAGFLGDPFERVAPAWLEEEFAGRRFFATHGDLINRKDRQYRMWRAFSKSRLTQSAFGLLPVPTRRRIIDRLERSLRNTNHRHRKRFPLEECGDFARPVFAAGADAIVLGHFHEERVIRYPESGEGKAVYVLPAWYTGGGYLRFRGDAEGEFIWADGRSRPAGEIAAAGAA